MKTCPFCGAEGEAAFNVSKHEPNCYIQNLLRMREEVPKCEETEKLWNSRASNIGTLQVKLSVLDSEPMSDLVDIICGYPRDQLPEDLQEKLVEWTNKHTSEGD